MKTILFALTLFVSVVQAAEIKVLDVPSPVGLSASTKFNVNADLGRAWVEIYLNERFNTDDDDREYDQSFRKLVPGLSFAAEAGVIVLEHEGQLIDCATVEVKGRSIFRRTVINQTGCDFQTKVITVEVDNGFEIKKQKRLQVFLVTK